MNFINRIMPAVALFTAAVIIAFLGYLYYLLTWDFNIVTLKDFTVPAQVQQGPSIPYTLSFDKHLSYKPSIRYYVLEPNQMPIEIITSAINRPAKDQTVHLALTVPQTLPIGCGYHIQIELDYQIIFNRDIPYHWSSNQFCITAPKQEKGVL